MDPKISKKIEKNPKNEKPKKKEFFYQKPKLELDESENSQKNKLIELETRSITEPSNLENWIELILVNLETKGLKEGQLIL